MASIWLLAVMTKLLSCGIYKNNKTRNVLPVIGAQVTQMRPGIKI
jgi:hypothetical protein